MHMSNKKMAKRRIAFDEIKKYEEEDINNYDDSDDDDEDDDSIKSGINYLKAGPVEESISNSDGPKNVPVVADPNAAAVARERVLFWILMVHLLITFVLLLVLVVPLIHYHCFQKHYKVVEVPAKRQILPPKDDIAVTTSITPITMYTSMSPSSNETMLKSLMNKDPHYEEYYDSVPDDYSNYYERPEEEEDYLSPGIN